MSGVLRGILGARSLLRGPAITQRAGLVTKPARDPVGPTETAVGLTVFAVAILGPSGWVLANLEYYKKRE
ncbi:cytochrome c oxidase subunit 8B, mitochondrial-like [Arapaima gigas]